MTPRHLSLVNFLSYAKTEVPFAGLHVVVLAGKNGEGKSALLDAMTWAVWGKGRGSGDAERVRIGQRHMSVVFEFEVSGCVYRVSRKWVANDRGSGSAQLEFHQLTDAGWKALTGAKMNETQAEIIRCVRMDYETFSNSAFIAQGHANEFTTKNPRDRKEVFRKILGLEVFETLSGFANDRRREAERRSGDAIQQIARAEEEVQRLPAVREKLASVQAETERTAPLIASHEATILELTGVVAARDLLLRQAEDLARNARETASTLAAEEAARDRAAAEIASAQEALEFEEDAHSRHSQLLALRAAEASMAEALDVVRGLQSTAERARGEIAAERARLEMQLQRASADAQKARDAHDLLPALEAEEAQFTAREQGIVALQEQAGAVRQEAILLRDRRTTAEAEVNRCKAENRELLPKQEELEKLGSSGSTAECPLCRQPLRPEDVEHVVAEYRAQRKRLGELHDAASKEIKASDAALSKAEAERTRIESEVTRAARALEAERREHASRLGATRQLAETLPTSEQLVSDLTAQLDAGAFAGVAREALAAAEASLQETGYDGARHAALRREITELAPVEAEMQAIAAARARLDGLRALYADAEVRIATLTASLDRCRAQAAAAREELDSLEDATPRLRVAESEAAALKAHSAELQRELGGLQNEHARLLQASAQLEELRTGAAAHIEEKGLYTELTQAFGRDGVQAMLIEQSLPRLEQIANAMLDRMTGGRITVSVRTQRTTATGGVRETLDIHIGDELGTRSYEMYSGGEAFRVDFALRIALAKLLAERAGAEPATLIIDEGFGSQDAEGIDRLVDAINEISQDFKLILVVTHVDEMRARFEQRIEVTKDARGSCARIA
jgi:exonuclease SbcC